MAAMSTSPHDFTATQYPISSGQANVQGQRLILLLDTKQTETFPAIPEKGHQRLRPKCRCVKEYIPIPVSFYAFDYLNFLYAMPTPLF